MVRTCIGFAVFACLAAIAAAQESPAAQDRATSESPLGIRQQRIEQMTSQLEQKFKQLTLVLQATEPRQAERLQTALNRSKELQLQKRMGDARRALDSGQLDAAASQQQALLGDLQSLIAMLLALDAEAQSAAAESERLAELTRTIERLLETQRSIKRASDAVAADAAATKAQAESIAEQQDKLMEKTSDLAEGMGQPGGQNVTAAKSAMQGAAASLRGQNAKAAGRQQTDAINELLAALDDIKERQQELDAAREAEKLAELAGHFREMLDEQQRITAQTAAVEAKRAAASGQLARPDRNAVRVLGELERRLEPIGVGAEQREAGLAGKAQQALDILTGGGASIALPPVISQLREDLIQVGNLLADDLKTGAEVRRLQEDIEETLQTLVEVLEAAKKHQASSESSAAASGSGRGKQPSLPASAELMLLRAAQLQLNRRTAALEQLRAASETLAESHAEATKAMADRQAKIAEMTARILDRQP